MTLFFTTAWHFSEIWKIITFSAIVIFSLYIKHGPCILKAAVGSGFYERISKEQELCNFLYTHAITRIYAYLLRECSSPWVRTECILNTLKPGQDVRHFAGDIFKPISWMKIYEFSLRFHWNWFLKIELTIYQRCFREWLGGDQATNHYLNQWWLDNRRIYALLGLNELIFHT